MFTDSLGRTFDDELTAFLLWFFNKRGQGHPQVPFKDPLSFVEGVTGVVIFRKDAFQVQHFIVNPNVVIPDHKHPNVDSYEVALAGMQFSYRGEQTELSWDQGDDNGLPRDALQSLRVHPSDKHGALASPQGGTFLSVQHWLNGVTPTSVGNDWEGETMGASHDEQSQNKRSLQCAEVG